MLEGSAPDPLTMPAEIAALRQTYSEVRPTAVVVAARQICVHASSAASARRSLAIQP